MKRLIIICMVFFTIFTSTNVVQAVNRPTKESVAKKPKKKRVAKYKNFTLELKKAEKVETDEGKKMIRVYAIFKNKDKEPYYADSCFGVVAFQKGKEIQRFTNVNGIDDNTGIAIEKDMKIEVSYFFEIENDSEVKVYIQEPTAEAKTLVKKIYFKNK